MIIKYQKNLIEFTFLLFLLIPLSLITGPFLPDLFLTIIIFNFLILSINTKEYSALNFKYLLIFLIFCSILTIISIYYGNLGSIKSSLFYFRFGIFSLAAYYLILQKKNTFKILLKIISIIFFLLFIDSVYQYFYFENLIGFKYLDRNNFRITSFFGDDEVLGSYVSRLSPLLLFLFIFNNEKISLRKKILFTVFFITTFTTVLLSGERTSLALFILFIIIIIFSSIKLRKLAIIPLILSMLISSAILSSSEKIKNRVITKTINQLGLTSDSERLVLFGKIYEGHFIISLNMFKEKPIFGHGAKSFRYYCSKEENFVANNACSTHPHNFYAQMLAEVGLFGFVSLSFIFLSIVYLFLKNFYYQIFKRKQYLTDFAICLLSSYFITLFPLLPSGNFFNNWLSILIYYPLGFLIYIYNQKKFYV